MIKMVQLVNDSYQVNINLEKLIQEPYSKNIINKVLEEKNQADKRKIHSQETPELIIKKLKRECEFSVNLTSLKENNKKNETIKNLLSKFNQNASKMAPFDLASRVKLDVNSVSITHNAGSLLMEDKEPPFELEKLIGHTPARTVDKRKMEAFNAGNNNKIALRIQNEIRAFYDIDIHTLDASLEKEKLDKIKFDLKKFEQLSTGILDNAWGRELAEKHWEAIGATRDNYLERFLKAFEHLNGFYEDFVSLKGELSKYMGSANDKGEVYFDGNGFKAKLQELIDKYSAPSAEGQLFPDAGENASKEECEKWIKQMGLSEGSLHFDSTTGKYTVRIDLGPLNSMKNGMPGSGNISANRLNAWETGFNAQGDILQSTLQMFTQKMTNANSLYENLIKIFSSFIEQDLSAARGYLNF